MMVKGSALDSEDLLQDVLLKAFKNREGFQSDSQLYTWLYSIARNTVYDAFRRLKTQRKYIDKPSEGTDFEYHGQEDENLERRERFRLFHQALKRLPKEQEELIRMKDFEEMSYQEIGEVLQIPSGTAKSRLFKARLALKQTLEQLGYTH